jgi:hypothetical protein
MVIVPVRDPDGGDFAATENVAVPLPLPLAPPVIVRKPLLLTAVQVQPAVVVTLTEPAPAA